MTWWQHKKDANYYVRLGLINKVKIYAVVNLSDNKAMLLIPPVPYSYNQGKLMIVAIEKHKYMSNFKREFTNIRVILDDGTTVPLAKLRTKHLTKIYQLLLK